MREKESLVDTRSSRRADDLHPEFAFTIILLLVLDVITKLERTVECMNA